MRCGPVPGTDTARREAVSVANMRAAWGDDAPDWVAMLAEVSDRQSQASVGRTIGYSAAVVSQVVNNRYPGDLERVGEAVRAALMAETTTCPEFGHEIALATCLEHQKHAKAGNKSSAFRARMATACRDCPKRRGG